MSHSIKRADLYFNTLQGGIREEVMLTVTVTGKLLYPK
jgi:hypothetical protein